LNSAWYKIFADLLAHKSRTALAISSIAIGIFMLGTLLGMIDLQLAKMDASHQLSRPSHINLILKTDVPLAVADQIKTLPGVANVDRLTQFTVRFKTANNPEWQLGTALFRPDYSAQQYDVMTLLSGQWPKGRNLALERLSAKYAKLQQGDSIEFESPTGRIAFAVNGIIRHPFVKPPPFGGQLHFFISAEAAASFGIQPATFRQLLVQVTQPYSEQKARLIAADIRAKLSALGIGVNATLLQNPEKHWGRPFFSGINLILTLMAWASLVLSSVLILNTIAALITQQTDQIGIMKALGAPRLLIARIYLSEVFLVAVIAIILAVPLSLLGAYFSSRWLLDLFNIEMSGFEYSRRTVWLMLAGGLVAPLLAALPPIWRGASLTVREAIASYGLGADFSSNRFDQWLESKVFSRLPTLYAVSLGNLFRRKARMLWTQSVLIIAGVLFILIMSLIASVKLTLDNELARSRYNVRIGFSADQPVSLIKQITQSLKQTTGLEFWNRLPAELSKNNVPLNPTGSLGMQMLALPENTIMYQPLIVAGRWFETTDNQQKVLVLNEATAELNQVKVGDSIKVNLLGRFSSDWQVIGFYRSFASAGYSVEAFYAPLSTVQAITGRAENSSFALLSATVNNLVEEKNYADQLKQLFQDQHIPIDFYTTISTREQRQFAQNQFRPIISMLLGLASLIASVAGIGLSGMLAISVLQRTREIGMLRAIGASSKTIFRLFMLEGFFHGLIAWLISIPIAYLLAKPVSQKLGEVMLGIKLDFAFSSPAIWIWLGLVSLLVIIASYLPARNATQIAVRANLNG
jgi:putative ABC transport system permease protein